MKRLRALMPVLMLVGCATVVPPDAPVTIGTLTAPAPPAAAQDSVAVVALGALADNPLLRLAAKDATDTLAWVEANKATLGPLKTFRASQCPTAVILAIGDLREKVLALQARVRALEGRVAEGPKAPELILALTRLKFGDAPNPQAAIGQLKDDIGTRIAAVTLSCAGLFPAKQLADLARLAGRAGILSTPFAPLAGFLP